MYENLKAYVKAKKKEDGVKKTLDELKELAIAEYKMAVKKEEDLSKVVPKTKLGIKQTATYNFSKEIEEIEAELKKKKDVEKDTGKAIKILGKEALTVSFI